MSADTDPPAFVRYGVVYAFEAGVANALHGIAAEGTAATSRVTLAHVHRICCMTEVESSSHFTRLHRPNLVPGGCREAEPRCWECIWNSFESNSRMAVS